MSAILSADDLNDFISPGVACIKPVETLPQQQPADNANPYEVTTEDKVNAGTAPSAQISLTDCLACSGCVTSAEAVLVSLQSHSEVLDTLDRYPELRLPWLQSGEMSNGANGILQGDGKIFVASVSPQSRASLAATYNVSEREAGNMITQLLSGPYGLRAGGSHGSGFTWVIDTNVMREACLVAAAEEVQTALATSSGSHQKRPILTSACPGWICYAEKQHPHILPHLSALKSPQALTGTLLKSVLANKFGIPPEKVWHLAVMPCFDKKLEASRGELTSHTWHAQEGDAIRDVDCVITARELLMLAESRDISFPCLPRTKPYTPPFLDAAINTFLFDQSQKKNGQGQQRKRTSPTATAANANIGTSGGYLNHILLTQQSQHPGSTISIQRGRNADVAEYTLLSPTSNQQPIFKAARYYGFRNIQNLVRRLKPPKASRMPGASRKPMGGGARKPGPAESDYAYVEVMACPGGCTNGGGQIKVGDVTTLRQVGGTGVENGSAEQEVLPAQREWLAKVDEAYWSAEESDDEVCPEEGDGDGDVVMDDEGLVNGVDSAGGGADVMDGIDRGYIKRMLDYWAEVTGVELDKLLYTTYRAVESDVGKDKSAGGEMERVSALAVAQGGGW